MISVIAKRDAIAIIKVMILQISIISQKSVTTVTKVIKGYSI